ncbi:MAG TPA: trypsin-like peptidase domain-containing protein [Candidatus Acidoferrum sp.]
MLSVAGLADKLQITSNPPGTTFELDGVAVGATPFEKDFPGGYFHKTRTSMGSRLEHPVVARISLSGNATRECKLTEGAMNWISLNGRNRGEYWLLKSDHFHGQHHRQSLRRRRRLQPELSLEELVRQAKPAIVYLKGLESSGSGFFVIGTGVIVTNAHLACGEETPLTLLSNGQQLEAKVLHIDSDLDIALAKVERPPGKSDFPHLTLADASSVRQGENVWPSAIRANSGGPLLNSCGEVIAINTQKLIKKNVTGMGFALSASDLLEVLHRFYPNAMPLTENSRPPRVNKPLRPQASLSQARALNPPIRRRSLHRPPPMASALSLFPRILTVPKSLSMTNSSATPRHSKASSRQPRGPFEIPRPRLLAPHSRNSQLQQSLPQGHSRTNLLKQTHARDRSSFGGRFPTSLSSPSHSYSSPAKITAHCPEQTPCASIRFVRRADQGIFRFSFASLRGTQRTGHALFLSQ